MLILTSFASWHNTRLTFSRSVTGQLPEPSQEGSWSFYTPFLAPFLLLSAVSNADMREKAFLAVLDSDSMGHMLEMSRLLG